MTFYDFPTRVHPIAQQYVEKPLTWKRKDRDDLSHKFDIRWMVCVKSIKPLSVYMSLISWPRFADKPYSLTDIHGFEKHSAYQSRGAEVLTVPLPEIISEWNERAEKNVSYEKIQEITVDSIKQLFESAANEPPVCMGYYSRSGAQYALDVVYEKNEDGSVQPIILEANFSPDCSRAVGDGNYQDYFDHMFDTLFIDDSLHPEFVKKII